MQKILHKIKTINAIPNSCISQECYLTWQFLSDLDQYYPNFKDWFFNKVRPDVSNGRRKIIVKKSYDQVIAVAILKKEIQEKKICTFRVSENAKRNGIGTELMQESLEWLECKKPLITVNEENALEFEVFFKKFDFQQTEIINGLYRLNKKEIFYNASIKQLY